MMSIDDFLARLNDDEYRALVAYLDEQVHELKGVEADRINNAGIPAQAAYLEMSVCDLRSALDTLRRA